MVISDDPVSAAELVTDVWQEAFRAERCSVEFDLLGGNGGGYSSERAIWEERPASVGGQLRRWVSSEGAPGWTAWQRLYDFGDDATVAGLGLPTGIRHRLSENGCVFGSAGVELRFASPYLGMEFAWVPAGSFVMGSERLEALTQDPLTRVRISKGYWLGRHEVTQGQWEAVMGTNPSGFDECGADCPVETVRWDEVQEFLAALNGRMERSGREERYGLPSEAEWEYAARAGVSGEAGERHGPVDEVAWHLGNSGERTHEVGGKVANAWGLHDMLGNVFEWTASWAGNYPGGEVTDWRGPSAGSNRVFGGGSWGGDARYCRASSRGYGYPDAMRSDDVGLRLRRTR